MSFFDRKEEVIDLQMTQFGKQLFADGEFKPVYYAFFDDDIIYDVNYTGHTEAQNETSERIKTVPRLKTQYVHYGIETEFHNILKEIKTEDPDAKIGREQDIEKHFTLPAPIGNSDLMNDYAPAWSISFLKGDILSSSLVLSSSSDPIQHIPQIETKIKYETHYGDSQTLDEFGDLDPLEPAPESDADGLEPAAAAAEFEEAAGMSLNIKKDGLLILVEEENAFFEKENFDIEVFEVDSSGSLTPLYFAANGKIQESVDDLNMLEEDEFFEDVYTDSKFVEYFMSISTDDEIEESILCSYGINRSKDLLIDQTFDCEDKTDIVRRGPTGFEPLPANDPEDCF
jgi:hypothetical protein